MKKKSGSKPKRNTTRSVLRLPDLEHAKTGDRAAELNLGSIHKIPAEIRSRVTLSSSDGFSTTSPLMRGFAIETTLRSPITFEHARLDHLHGFWTQWDYVSASSVEESVRRITERSYRGSHPESERLVADIYGRPRWKLVRTSSSSFRSRRAASTLAALRLALLSNRATSGTCDGYAECGIVATRIGHGLTLWEPP